jgi:hypothetical protein
LKIIIKIKNSLRKVSYDEFATPQVSVRPNLNLKPTNRLAFLFLLFKETLVT